MILSVFEAYTRDVGRGVCRVDYDTMDKLNLTTGAVAILKSKKSKTAVKVLPLYPSDEKKKLCRVDGLVRSNLKIQIGQKIEIIKINDVKPAVEVKFFPVDKHTPPLDGTYLSDTLESVPVTQGDNVMIPYFGGRLTFNVVETKPKGIVIMHQKTTSIILEENIPAEVTVYEKQMKIERNKIIKNSKKEILKLIKDNKFDEAQTLAVNAKQKLDALKNSYKSLKDILCLEEEDEEIK